MGGRASREGGIFLEVGAKRVFASSVDWPGWCRSGRDERAALQALVAHAPRYDRAVRPARLGFAPVTRVEDLVVIERLKGDATTDFGAPGAILRADDRPLGEAEVKRLQAILRAVWAELDRILASASGRELRRGPRGGGRDLEAMIAHLLDADGAYLTKAGGRASAAPKGGPVPALRETREAILATMNASARGEIAACGPRGGKRWNALAFARRVAWHALDHAWEIEDRLV